MAEATALSDTDRREQALHARQSALDDALYHWQQDMHREEHTGDFEANERNLVALKGRRMVLLREDQSVGREWREIRRARKKVDGRSWWRRGPKQRERAG